MVYEDLNFCPRNIFLNSLIVLTMANNSCPLSCSLFVRDLVFCYKRLYIYIFLADDCAQGRSLTSVWISKGLLKLGYDNSVLQEILF